MTNIVQDIVSWVSDKTGITSVASSIDSFARQKNDYYAALANEYVVSQGYDPLVVGDVFKHALASMMETFERAKDQDYTSRYGLGGAYTSVQTLGVANELVAWWKNRDNTAEHYKDLYNNVSGGLAGLYLSQKASSLDTSEALRIVDYLYQNNQLLIIGSIPDPRMPAFATPGAKDLVSALNEMADRHQSIIDSTNQFINTNTNNIKSLLNPGNTPIQGAPLPPPAQLDDLNKITPISPSDIIRDAFGNITTINAPGQGTITVAPNVGDSSLFTINDTANHYTWQSYNFRIGDSSDTLVISGVGQYDTSQVWQASHFLPSDLRQYNEALAQVFVADLARMAFHGGAVETSVPNALSYEPNFTPSFDFRLGSYDVDFGAAATVGFVDAGLGWDAGAYQYWNGWTGQSSSPFPTYNFDPNWNYGDWLQPVVLDLNHDGIAITPRVDSTVYFDIDGNDNGAKELTAWAGAGDGLLVIDLAPGGGAGADGVINQAKEIAFAQWTAAADTDLEALAAVFDTNHDNAFDGSDDNWRDSPVWQRRGAVSRRSIERHIS